MCERRVSLGNKLVSTVFVPALNTASRYLLMVNMNKVFVRCYVTGKMNDLSRVRLECTFVIQNASPLRRHHCSRRYVFDNDTIHAIYQPERNRVYVLLDIRMSIV